MIFTCICARKSSWLFPQWCSWWWHWTWFSALATHIVLKSESHFWPIRLESSWVQDMVTVYIPQMIFMVDRIRAIISGKRENFLHLQRSVMCFLTSVRMWIWLLSLYSTFLLFLGLWWVSLLLRTSSILLFNWLF